MKLGVLALSLLLFAPGQAAQEAVQEDAKKALEQFEGDWLITEFDGNMVPPEAEAYLVFAGDKYEQWTMNQVDERGSFKIDITAKPMTVDLIITEGQSAGQTQLGVYEFKDDTLTVSLANPGVTTRPAALNRGTINVVLKKVN
jgi:uncharacterized protein (TIGR03067 family)